MIKYQIFKTLSTLNKALLPKLYKKTDLANLTKTEMLIAGWKRWVTFRFIDAKDARENQKRQNQ